MTDIPNPIKPDAPKPEDTKTDSVSTLGSHLWDTVAVTNDGEVYCLECANPAYVTLCKRDPYAIPYGGPVSRGSEWDYAPSCGHCHRRITDVSVLRPDE